MPCQVVLAADTGSLPNCADTKQVSNSGRLYTLYALLFVRYQNTHYVGWLQFERHAQEVIAMLISYTTKSALHRGRAPPGKPCAAVVVRGKLGCLGHMLTDQIQAVARKDARTLPQTDLFSFKPRLKKPERTLHGLVKANANIVVSLRVQIQLCRLPCSTQLLIE